jgi:diacylglycerol kinase (ATP)
MKTVAVVNPNAGRCKPVALPRDVEILETQAPGHAIQLTRDAIRRGARTIMAVGGDGTINEVVNGFFEEEQLIATDAELAVIAKGTGSDFSRSLNHAVPSGERRLIDVMRVRYTAIDGVRPSRYSINVTSFGIGGEVAARVSRPAKSFSGRMAYFAGMLRTALSYSGKLVTIELNNSQTIEEKILNVAAGNGQYHGAGMWVCPGAILDDGLLDVTVIRDMSLGELARGLGKLYSGGIYSHPKVQAYRVNRLSAASKESVLVEIDGELVGKLPIEISIVPKAIRVWVP